MDGIARWGKRALLAVTAGLVLALCVPAIAPADPTTPQDPSRNIEDYVVFALTDMHLKTGTVIGGDLGTNRASTGGGDYTVALDDDFQMPDDSQVVGDQTKVGLDSSIWELFANTVNPAFDPSVIRNGPRHTWTPP